MKLFKKVSLLLCALLIATSASAIDLKQAKTAGMVGEQQDGYLGEIKSSPEVTTLVTEVNAKRRAAYEKIAVKNNLTLQQVAKLAGEKAIKKTPQGQYIQAADGSWQKK